MSLAKQFQYIGAANMKATLVGHIMTSAVLSIEVHEPVTEVIRLFASYPIHHLPVVDERRIVGILSTADMLKLEYFTPKSSSLASSTILNERFSIAKLMRSPALTVTVEDTISDAATKMSSFGIHALPVINSAGYLIGIVTTTDIMSAFLSGIAESRSATPSQEGNILSKHRMSQALEAARESLQRGEDDNGLAACTLYLHERIELLEALRKDAERYMRGGQDEQLHSKLLKDIDHINQQEHAALALRL